MLKCEQFTQKGDCMNKLKEKYNLFTAICLVVGIVVGTGIFFKTGVVLGETNGSFWLAILAWIIGGLIMISCGYNFANISTIHHNINNLSDFAEATIGKKYAYLVGAFAKNIYFPSMTSTVSFVAGMYTCELFNIKGESYPFTIPVFLFAFGYLIAIFIMNMLAPIIAGKVQVSTTIIKMIPLLLMAIIGTIVGLTNGTLANNMSFEASAGLASNRGFFAAVCVTAFSYEGWICATNIGEEIKNRRKNLPIALVIGTFVVMIIYILYNFGISGAIDSESLIAGGSSSESVKHAFTNLFGNASATILNVIVVISALGTLNGLTMANSRASYALAKQNKGLGSKLFLKVSKHNVPTWSSVYGVCLAIFWLLFYFLSQTNKLSNGIGFPFSSDELPIITTYLIYIPMFISMMKNENHTTIFKRYIMPAIGIVAALLMITASIYRHGINTLYYLIFFTIFVVIAFIIYYKNENSIEKNNP